MSLVQQYMRIRDPRRGGAEGTKTTQRSNPPHGGPMSIEELCSSQRDDRSWIWSRRWANAGAASPFPGTSFPKASKSQDLLATTGRTRCTPGRWRER